MNTLFTTILVGISLSMDAFSLSLIYGMQNFSRKNILKLSLIVGLFHFFMPLIGLFFGNVVFHYLMVDSNFVVGIIFGLLGIEMFISSFRSEEVKILIGFVPFLLFGLSVSIDSLTTGIGLSSISDNYWMVSSIFMFFSAFFTYLGLKLGGFLSDRFGKAATMFGGSLMIFLAFFYIF